MHTVKVFFFKPLLKTMKNQWRLWPLCLFMNFMIIGEALIDLPACILTLAIDDDVFTGLPSIKTCNEMYFFVCIWLEILTQTDGHIVKYRDKHRGTQKAHISEKHKIVKTKQKSVIALEWISPKGHISCFSHAQLITHNLLIHTLSSQIPLLPCLLIL